MGDGNAENASPSNWLEETAERAERNLQSIRPELRSPATKLLIGPDVIPCEACNGRGSVLRYREGDPYAPTSNGS